MNATAKATGRPSLYSRELIEKICERIAMGESLEEICACVGFPSEGTVYRWLSDDLIFQDLYARARDVQADRGFDQAWKIARDATVEDAHVARLQVDTIKWRVGKLSPRKYGDVRRTELTGADGGAIQVETREIVDLSMLDPEARDQMRDLIEAARARAAVDVTPRDGEDES